MRGKFLGANVLKLYSISSISPVLFLEVSSSDLNYSSCIYYPFYGKQIVIIKGARAGENHRRKGTPAVSGSIIRVFHSRDNSAPDQDDEVQGASEGTIEKLL